MHLFTATNILKLKIIKILDFGPRQSKGLGKLKIIKIILIGYLPNNLHDFKLGQESQVSAFKYNSCSGEDLCYWANSVKWRRIVGVFEPISWSENLGFTNRLKKHTGLLSCSAYDTSLTHTNICFGSNYYYYFFMSNFF